MPATQRKKKTRNDNTETKPTEQLPEPPEPGMVPWGRIRARIGIAVALMIAVYFYNEYTAGLRNFASVSEKIDKKYEEVTCSKDYKKEISQFPECIPKRCGRLVSDAVVSEAEAKHMLRTAKRGLEKGGSNGGASILDLHSGAVSKGDKFINIYNLMKETGEEIFTEKDFTIYNKVKNKIHNAIAEAFDVPMNKLYLTSPTFFSRMTTRKAKTVHDEYWHIHVDKETYGSFHYTSLLYLNDYSTDFEGGRFVFVEGNKNVTVEPRLGRLSFFTSGSENPHFVEPLKSGNRYAVTVSFTCDPDKAIQDPQLK